MKGCVIQVLPGASPLPYLLLVLSTPIELLGGPSGLLPLNALVWGRN